MATNACVNDTMAKLTPGGARALAQLSDDELLANTRRLVGKSNQLLATLLAHLAEVETRGVHRTRRCASLYTYCIYELRFSEDAAARRSAAARLTKEFPALLEAVAAGELHLTALLMIGPHLTTENHERVLARAKFRTKKELTKLIRDLNPLPDIPDCIQPLGPALPPSPRNPTWQQFVTALSPQVRQLPAAERPSTWANDGIAAAEGNGYAQDDEALPVGPVPSNLPPVTGPQQFQIQFATVEEHVQLVERAKALLARRRPRMTLGELHLEAMRLLVGALEKKKFAVTERPRQRDDATEDAQSETEAPRQRVTATEGDRPDAIAPRQRVTVTESDQQDTKPGKRRERSRYIPAEVRREVYGRDGARCTYIDARGQRCPETHYLELHHLWPFAKNGVSVASNLTLRCASHNALAAEQDFGSAVMATRRDSTTHQARAHQQLFGKPPFR
jgi:5-methylcytosine-specific restriction endonuclease McrA